MRRTSKVDVTQYLVGDLTIQRIWWSRVVQHAWQFPWRALTATQKSTLTTFFATCRGRILGDIAYTCPFDGLSYVCRLDQDEIIIANDPMPIWSSSLNLIECNTFKALKAPVAAFPATVPFQALTLSHRYNTIIEAQQQGTEKRYEDWASPIHRWTVGGPALTQAQAEDLIDIWEASGGPYATFTFTDPDTSTGYNAHFTENTIGLTMIAPDVWACTATVEELP